METRETLREKGWNEEQITDYLNLAHSVDEEKRNLQGEQSKMKEFEQKATELQKQLDEINKSKMTEQEQIELAKKEANENLNKSKIIYNKAKAKEILAGYDIDDNLLNSLVNADENATLNNANLLKSKFDIFKEAVEKQTKESIIKTDVKPQPTNIPQGEEIVDVEKFNKMNLTERKAFKDANPDEFAKLSQNN